MVHRLLHGRHDDPSGWVIDRARLYEWVASIEYLGRRRRVYRRIVALSGARPGDHALDVGCGGGYLARLLAEAVGPNGRVTGVDPSRPAIDYANRRAGDHCTFVVGAAQELELPDRSFDVVTATLAVHHVPEDKQQAAFGEMYRVLRPGGRLMVADFRPGRTPPVLKKRGHAAHHASPPLDELARAAGFHVEDRGELPRLGYIQAKRPDEG